MRDRRTAYLVSPCSSAPFRWGRRSCLGLRTGVSPHFSMNSMREILALRGGYERGRVPLPSPMPPESGAPPHNTHPSVVLPCHQPRPRHPFLSNCSLFSFALSLLPSHARRRESYSPFHSVRIRFDSFIFLFLFFIFLFVRNSLLITNTTAHHEDIIQHGITPNTDHR